MSEGQCILTSSRRLQRSGSPSGWAASGSLHSALKCSPPPGPEGYTDGQTERVIWLGLRDRGSAVTSQSAPKPTDPALSLGLDNATQQALTSTHTHRKCSKLEPFPNFFLLWTRPSPLYPSGSWTSRSSASCCHLGPGRSTPERVTDRLSKETEKWVRQRWKKVNCDFFNHHAATGLCTHKQSPLSVPDLSNVRASCSSLFGVFVNWRSYIIKDSPM